MCNSTIVFVYDSDTMSGHALLRSSLFIRVNNISRLICKKMKWFRFKYSIFSSLFQWFWSLFPLSPCQPRGQRPCLAVLAEDGWISSPQAGLPFATECRSLSLSFGTYVFIKDLFLLHKSHLSEVFLVDMWIVLFVKIKTSPALNCAVFHWQLNLKILEMNFISQLN